MQISRNAFCVIALAGLSLPAFATVKISTLGPSPKSPQPLGTNTTWLATGTDTNTNSSCAANLSCLLTFQFSVTDPVGNLSALYQFNAGTFSSGTWTSTPWKWTPTTMEGTYQITVVAKDWTTGETATKTSSFQATSLVSGSQPAATPTANPLVFLFSAPSCPTGSSMQVVFQQQSQATPATTTPAIPCHPPSSMNFELAGMYANTPYAAHSQTITGKKTTNGPIVTFTTGTLPSSIPFPPFTVIIPAGSKTDTTDSMILWNLVLFGIGTTYPDVATDLQGNIMWYYYTDASGHYNLLTRPLAGGHMLTIQNAGAWSTTNYQQTLREIDVAGNVIRETNTGIVQQQLLALGATDAMPCNLVKSPAPVGTGCLNAFHHDAIQSLPNGQTAALVSVEKIFPPGTQGDKSGLPVDILGDMILVLDTNWNVVWYFDTFQHDSGPPQLSITRPSVLPATCVVNQQGCPPIFLLGPGISPVAYDWLHANSLYYWPQDQDIVWSSKDQDWVMKVDYRNGTGTANILWRLGKSGDFVINNVFNDPWPWFSSQHDVGIENGGTGPWTIFDNGDTRVTVLGSSHCLPYDCDSRGIALLVNESTMMATPTLSVDLGVYSSAGGSAQLLAPGAGLPGEGDFFFYPPVVFQNLTDYSYAMELPSSPATGAPPKDLNIQGASGYRSWRLANLYYPPTT